MTVERPQIDRPARPAARTEDVEPRRPGHQRSAYRGRPQHVAAGGKASIPAVNDELCRKARGVFRSLAAPAWMSSPRVLTLIAVVSGRQLERSIRLLLSRFRRTFAGGAGCG